MRLKGHFIVLLLLCGAGTAVAQNPLGKIIIYRESDFADTTYIPPVFCDGKEIGRVIGGTYVEVFTLAGSHACAAESAKLPATSVEVAPGSVFYLRLNVKSDPEIHAYLSVATEADYSRETNLISLIAPVQLGFPQQIAPSPPAPPKPVDRALRFGGLTVTVLEIDSHTERSAGNSGVALLAEIKNRGSDTICASLLAHLETSSRQEYDALVTPNTYELSPGEIARGTFQFPSSSGEKPSMFWLQLEDRHTVCAAGVRALHLGVSTPSTIRIDLSDLPGSAPLDAQSPNAHTPRNDGFGDPSRSHCPNPSYTDAARKAKFQGTVKVQIVIKADGTPGDVQLIKSSGYGDLDQKSLDTVQTWRFEPATAPDGNPISISVPVEFTFRLL